MGKYRGVDAKALVNKQHWAVGRFSIRESIPGTDCPDSEGRPANDGSLVVNQKVKAATVSSCTNAVPSVVTTAAAHGLVVGQLVTITGSNETDLNGSWKVTVVGSTTTFSLNNATALAATANSGSVYAGGVVAVGANAVVPGIAKCVINFSEPTWDSGNNPFATPYLVQGGTFDLIQLFIDGNVMGSNYWLFYSALCTQISEDGDVQRDTPVSIEWTSDGLYLEPGGTQGPF